MFRYYKMIHANLFNAKDIDPAALEGDPFESVCLQLANQQKRGRPRWTPQEIKEKLIEIAAEGEEDTDENMQSLLTLAGSAVLADVLLKFVCTKRTVMLLCIQGAHFSSESGAGKERHTRHHTGVQRVGRAHILLWGSHEAIGTTNAS